MRTRLLQYSVAAFCMACSLPAAAHITLEQREAPVGAPYKAVFRVPHGCEESPTVRVTVRIPEGVTTVSWSGGKLPDAFYDEFVLSVFIAGDLAPGRMLYFPVVQTCERGEHQWIEVPPADKPDAPLGDPAPGVMLTPKK